MEKFIKEKIYIICLLRNKKTGKFEQKIGISFVLMKTKKNKSEKRKRHKFVVV